MDSRGEYNSSTNLVSSRTALHRLSSSETFIQAVTKPNQAAYREILKDSPVFGYKAFVWIFACAVIATLVQAVRLTLFPVRYLVNGQVATISPTLFLLVAPLAGVLNVILFATIAAVMNRTARRLGGTGDYIELCYTWAASFAPLLVASTVLGLVPVLGEFLTFILGVYQLYLVLLVLKTVHRLVWASTLGTVLITAVLVFSGFLLLVWLLAPILR